MARRLKNFIDGFVKYLDGKGSPTIFTKWAGIFSVAAACERKVWTVTAKGRTGILYPNLYVVITGPAGVGKSLCTSTVYELINDVRGPEVNLHLAPTSATKASFIDALHEAERRIIRPMETPSIVTYNSLIAIPNELGVLLSSYEGEFMSTLTDLWDCGPYKEKKRTKSLEIEIPKTQVNILTADTPAHLNNLLPEGAWEQGFMSRTLMVFSGEVIFTDLFTRPEDDEGLWEDLKHDLKDIYKQYGQLYFTDETKAAINAWGMDQSDAPNHPKLVGYNNRRVAQLLKLCMIAAVASGSKEFIELDHFAEALDWLTEAEKFMPDVFKSMKGGGDGRAIEECWHFAYQWWLKKKEPIPEHLVYAFLQERVPAHSVDRILDVMVKSSLLSKKFTTTGGTGYEPKAMKAG